MQYLISYECIPNRMSPDGNPVKLDREERFELINNHPAEWLLGKKELLHEIITKETGAYADDVRVIHSVIEVPDPLAQKLKGLEHF
jgi:hypothetical protein